MLRDEVATSPRRVLAVPAVIKNEVAPEVTGAVSLVCWDRELYLRTGICRPIGYSGHGLGTEAFASGILLQDAA